MAGLARPILVLALASPSAALDGPGAVDLGPEAVFRAEDAPVLVVNGEPVMRSRLRRLMAPVLRPGADPLEVREYQRQAVAHLVQEVLCSQYLRKRGYEPSPEEARAEIARWRRAFERSPVGPGRTFEASLESFGVTAEELERRLPLAWRMSACVHSTVTEADLARMFETARDAFTGRRVRASHVLVSTEYARTDAEKAEARRKAERLRAGILAGADFAEVARAHSECPSRESGGDLGFISRRGQLVEEFARAAFALEPGEVSGVVESRVGFHVVKVTAEEKGRDVALDEVREEVTRAVVEDRTREILAELRAGARIVDPNAPGE